MVNLWLLVFIGIAAADWLAVWHKRQQISYLTKPAALAALLIWYGLAGHFKENLLWFGVGLFLSFLGDIFLMLTHGYFSYGLAAFLLAHLAYISVLSQPLPQVTIPFYVLGLTLVSNWLIIFGQLCSAMKASTAKAKVVWPVGIYSAMITVMLFFALMTLFHPGWKFPAAVLVSVGGLLFYCSDTMLAYDRFIRPFARARFWVRVTYHLGQLGLAAGVLLNYLS